MDNDDFSPNLCKIVARAASVRYDGPTYHTHLGRSNHLLCMIIAHGEAQSSHVRNILPN
jgi:hypothetical protein